VNAQQNLSVSSLCNPVTNLSAIYTSDCKAILTWDEPAKSKSDVILWDNTNIYMFMPTAVISSYWSVNDNWIFTADDFDANSVWVIKKIYAQGHSNPPSALPIKFAIVIYYDDAGKPGTEIYRNTEIFVTDGADPEIILPEPFELPCAGRYWITIAGTYDVNVSSFGDVANYRWNIRSGHINIGLEQHVYDKMGLFGTAATWESFSSLGVDDAKSMWFKIEGTPGAHSDDYTYKIYRDGNIIATVENVNSHTDTDFDEEVEHTWEIVVVCEDDESDPVSKLLPACKSPCNPVTSAVAVINAGCLSATLTWATVTGATGYKISRDGIVLDTVTTTIYTEEATFESGVSYKWHIVTICDAEESTFAESVVESNCLKINELVNSVAVYPNPANSMITIIAKDFVKVEIYNSMGQLVNSYEQVNVVDVSSYKAGIYFFKIATLEGGIKYFKVVVTN
jgi:hypothetical protein